MVHWFGLATPDAIAAYQEVLDLRGELDDPAGTIWPLSQIGSALALQARYEEGIQTSLAALRVCREGGDRTTKPAIHDQLGLGALLSGDAGYLTSFEEGLALAREIDHRVWVAIGAPLAARSRLILGEPVEPFRDEDLAEWLDQTSGSPLWQAFVTTFAGQVRRGLGDAAGAIALLEPAAVQTEAIGAYVVAMMAWTDLGLAQVAAGDPAAAEVTAGRIAALVEQTGAEHYRAVAAWIRGLAADRAEDLSVAADALREAPRLARTHRSWPLIWPVAADLARVLGRLGRPAEAAEAGAIAAQAEDHVAGRLPTERRAAFLARAECAPAG